MSDDLTRLTDEEIESLRTWDDGSYHCPCRMRCMCDDAEKVHLYDAVASILAARTAALIDRAERAERERDEQADELAFLRERKSKYMAGLGERFASEIQARTQLAALRAAVTGLADQWEERAMTCCSLMCQNCGARYIDPDHLRAMLTDEGDNQ